MYGCVFCEQNCTDGARQQQLGATDNYDLGRLFMVQHERKQLSMVQHEGKQMLGELEDQDDVRYAAAIIRLKRAIV